MTSATKSLGVLHRCDPDRDDPGCECMYDPQCTGVFSRRLIPVPVWLGCILWPRHSWRVYRTRRTLLRFRNSVAKAGAESPPEGTKP